MTDTYDIVIPVVKKNLNFFLHYTLPMLKKNLNPDRIFLLGNKDLACLCHGFECEFVDENCIVEKLTLEKIKILISQRGGKSSRAGWYFQQFLKMGWARVTNQPFYLVWDADTLPLNKINFFDDKQHILFNEKTEYHKPYFATIETIFSKSVHKAIKGSFIAEHMLIASEPMKQMLKEIEDNVETGNMLFFEKIMNAVPIDVLSHSGFSEFETFGSWVMMRFPGLYVSRHLRTMRQGGTFLGVNPSNYHLQKAGEFYDVVSCEMYDRKRFNVAAVTPILTRILMCFGVSLPKIVSVYNFLRLLYRNKLKDDDIFIVE